MKEILEIRIEKELVSKLHLEALAKNLGIIYVVSLSMDDPRIEEIKRADSESRKKGGGSLYFGWDLTRKYTDFELRQAEWFHFFSVKRFEPSAEECGTFYDDTAACPECGAGAMIEGPVKLNVSCIPKNADLAETIAGELVISERLASLLEENRIKGYKLKEVNNIGKKIVSGKWWSLSVSSVPLKVKNETKIGENPIVGYSSEHRCPMGDTLGLTCLSELFCSRTGYDGSDFCQTEQFFGSRMGLLRPSRYLLINQKVRRILLEHKVKGYSLEVSHVG